MVTTAEEILKKFVQRAEIPIYDKLLGMVNLTQSYIVLEKFENALETIREVIRVAQEKRLNVIWANAYQCLADIFIEQGAFEKAQVQIKQLKNLIH